MAKRSGYHNCHSGYIVSLNTAPGIRTNIITQSYANIGFISLFLRYICVRNETWATLRICKRRGRKTTAHIIQFTDSSAKYTNVNPYYTSAIVYGAGGGWGKILRIRDPSFFSSFNSKPLIFLVEKIFSFFRFYQRAIGCSVAALAHKICAEVSFVKFYEMWGFQQYGTFVVLSIQCCDDVYIYVCVRAD